MASPTLQGALKDNFGEVVMACDILDPCKVPSFHSCQKRFLWNQKKVGLAPHPVVGLVLQVGVTENFLRHLVSKAWILVSVSKQGPSFTTIEEDGGDKRLLELELICESDDVAPPDSE